MRVKEFGESDLLVNFFTADRGRLAGVAKGGRRSRRRFANCLDLFCLARLEYGQGKKGDLFFLDSGRLINGFAGLRADFESLSLASYMTELTETLFPQNVTDTAMFELLRDSFAAIDARKDIDLIRIYFEARAMTLGGYRINLESCARCGRPYTGVGKAVFLLDKGGIACLNCERPSSSKPELGTDAVKTLVKMQSESLEKMDLSALNPYVVRELGPILKHHIETSLGKPLKSARYLRQPAS